MSQPTPGVLYARANTWRRAIAEARRVVDTLPPGDPSVGERILAALIAQAKWDTEHP